MRYTTVRLCAAPAPTALSGATANGCITTQVRSVTAGSVGEAYVYVPREPSVNVTLKTSVKPP